MTLIPLRVMVLGESKNDAALLPSGVSDKLSLANRILAPWAITLEAQTVCLLQTDKYTKLPKPHWYSVLSSWFWWFSGHAGKPLPTVFVVKAIEGRNGWAVPWASWFVVGAGAGGTTWIHEALHLTGWLTHDKDVNNIMHRSVGWRLTREQAEALRGWKYARTA